MRSKALLVDRNIGIGDAVQFTSLPENYFKHTGQKLIDVDKHWVFDHNPYIDRETRPDPNQIFKIWNHRPFIQPKGPDNLSKEQAHVRMNTFLSNAEIHARLYDVPVVLNRPRLYQFEDYPFKDRNMILVHIQGKSHGTMPAHIIDHIISKYSKMRLFQIGLPTDLDIGIPRIKTETLWQLASVIARARMFIGMDSGPSWIAACYPDVVIKKVRTRPVDPQTFKDWIPLDFANIHSHWDDRLAQIHNVTEEDIGFTWSYKRI